MPVVTLRADAGELYTDYINPGLLTAQIRVIVANELSCEVPGTKGITVLHPDDDIVLTIACADTDEGDNLPVNYLLDIEAVDHLSRACNQGVRGQNIKQRIEEILPEGRTAAVWLKLVKATWS